MFFFMADGKSIQRKGLVKPENRYKRVVSLNRFSCIENEVLTIRKASLCIFRTIFYCRTIKYSPPLTTLGSKYYSVVA